MSESEPSKETPTRPSRSLPSWAAFVSMGMTFAVLVAAGLLLGLWLDSLCKTSPLFLFLGLLVGFAVAIASVVALVRKSL